MTLLLTVHVLSRRLPSLLLMFMVSMLLLGGQAHAISIVDTVTVLVNAP